MTILDAIKWTTLQLKGGFVLNPRGEAEMIVTAKIGMTKTDIYMFPCRVLSPKEKEAIKGTVAERLTGKPLQYILGYQQFRYLEIICREGVLIPRPETELLVEFAITEIEKLDKPIAIDLGCGTGAIGISIAHECPGVFVYMLDKYRQAITLTRENIQKTGLEDRTKVIESDIFNSVTELQGIVDIIISNPPYIRSSDLQDLQREVHFEPETALDGGEDGLNYYRAIASQAPLFLRQNGVLLLEVGFDQSRQVADILRETGLFKEIEIKQDYAGIERIVKAKKLNPTGVL